jgi:DNA-binding NarL/FixJ family response regulator
MIIRASGALTRRERQVLALIRAQLGNKEIAQRLGVATNTVKVYVHSLLVKRGVSYRWEL